MILKQASNKACAFVSALFIAFTEENKSPSEPRPKTKPTVMLFTAPGFKIKGPAD